MAGEYKSTKGVRNLIKDLEDMELKNIDQVKNKFENWEKYFNLYCKSYKEFTNEKKEFIEFLDAFDNFNKDISEDKSLLHDYSKNVTEACDDVRQQVKNTREEFDGNNKIFNKLLNKVKQYIKNEIDGSILQAPKAYGGEKLLKAEFLKDLDDCKAKEFDKVNEKLLNAAEEIAEQLHHTKHDISKFTGILSDKSIDRNVLNKNEDTPLKILKELYKALTTPNSKFPKYKGKDLLKLPKNKTLDSKVGRSMKKLTKCNFGNYFKVRAKLVASADQFKKTMSALNNFSSTTSNAVKEFFQKYKGVNTMTGYLKVNAQVEKDIKGHLDGLKGQESELKLMKLYNLVLTHREQLKIISQSFVALNDILIEIDKKDAKNILAIFYKDKKSKAKIVSQILKITGFILGAIVPVAGTVAKAICTTTAEVLEIANNAASSAQTIAETVNEKFLDN